MNAPALFVRDGDGYLATADADGPWATGALHGGAPTALLAHLLVAELADSGLRLARLTCEFVRPTPRGPLRPRIEVVRPGRRITLLGASLLDESGTEVTRAGAMFLRASEVSAGDADPPPFPGPEAGEPEQWDLGRPSFAVEGMEMRFVAGRFHEPGPGTCWFRMRSPLVAGEPNRPLDAVAAAADFGNGIGSVLSWSEHTFINADLTVFCERDPVDEWVALDSRMFVRAGSVATAESVLWDRRGRIGRAVQTVLVDAAPAPGAT